jgi:hypothetical protein
MIAVLKGGELLSISPGTERAIHTIAQLLPAIKASLTSIEKSLATLAAAAEDQSRRD